MVQDCAKSDIDAAIMANEGKALIPQMQQQRDAIRSHFALRELAQLIVQPANMPQELAAEAGFAVPNAIIIFLNPSIIRC